MGKSMLPGHIKAFQMISEPRPSEIEALTESHKFVPGQTERIICLGKPTMFKVAL